jgi:hypothetical protein
MHFLQCSPDQRFLVRRIEIVQQECRVIECYSNRQGATWQKLRATLTPVLTGAGTVFGFFPALNIVTDEFIDLIRERRINFTVRGFEELAYRMGLESKTWFLLAINFFNH